MTQKNINQSKNVDYHEAGKELLASLSESTWAYNDLDCIHKHPSGGKVYVGNISAAQSKAILKEYDIRRIVNCQDPKSENFHEDEIGFEYLRFGVSYWWAKPDAETNAGLRKFFTPFFHFVDSNIGAGRNVLIHCLAGAHRAGTCAVAYAMYVKKVHFEDALAYCKAIRPIINPFGQLETLLQRLDNALVEVDSNADGA